MINKTLTRSIALLSVLFLAVPSVAAVKNRDKTPIPYFSKKVTKTPLKYRFSPPIFDFPVTYNHAVKKWIRYYQTRGKNSFRRYLERSSRYAPFIKAQLEKHNLPQDLFYVAMIESGFTPHATSSANAVGIWQFIAPTARRYGLKVNWWIDERRNFSRATKAAISYKSDLYKMFGSWYLVSASYNAGENRVHRLIRKHKTNNFWELAKRRALAQETIDYVPKIIAATLIAKSPALYGFRNIKYRAPFQFEEMSVPGGTDLNNLAKYLGVKGSYMKALNPDLLRGFIPREIKSHRIKIPVGSRKLVSQYSKLIAKHRKM